MLSIDGVSETVNKSDGYIELNFYQQSFYNNSDGQIVFKKQYHGLNQCNKDDRNHFYDESD